MKQSIKPEFLALVVVGLCIVGSVDALFSSWKAAASCFALSTLLLTIQGRMNRNNDQRGRNQSESTTDLRQGGEQ